MASAGDLLNGRYRLVDVLGEGGVGTVYRAYDETSQRPVAVKVIRAEFASDPRFREALEFETRVAMTIDHPNLIPPHDVGTGEQFYVVTRLVAGADLGQRLRMTGRIPLEQTLLIGQQIASGLEVIHGTGLIHGDLKPANVLLAPSGGRDHVYVTDFGIARATVADLKISSINSSLAYRSPELFQNNHNGSASSDVYALACLTVQCLTGRTPFLGPEYRDYRLQHETSRPPQLADLAAGLPPALDEVIAVGLDKNPARRPAAVAWMNALREAASAAAKATPAARAAAKTPVVGSAPLAAAAAATTPSPVVIPPVAAAPPVPVAATAKAEPPKTPTPQPAPQPPPPPAVVPAQPIAPPPEAFDDDPFDEEPRSRRALAGWIAAGIVLVAAVAVAGFAISKANNHTSSTSSTNPSATTSPHPSASPATTASLTGPHTPAQAALFQRVSGLPLGECKAYVQPPTPTGQQAALRCTPGGPAVDSVVIRQFDTSNHEIGDAAKRPTAEGATTALGPCDPNGNPPNSRQVAAWGFWKDSSRQQGYIQCFPQNKSGGRELVLTYDSAAIEMTLIKNADSSAQAGADLYEWWDKHIRTTPLTRPDRLAGQPAHDEIGQQPAAKREDESTVALGQQALVDQFSCLCGLRGVEQVCCQPGAQPNLEHQPFKAPILCSEPLPSRCRALTGGEPGCVCGGLANIPPAHAVRVVPHKAVCPGTDAPPASVLPITQVVTALGAGARPVADLIPAVAGRRQQAISQLVAGGELIVIRRLHLAVSHLPGQPGALLHHQRVRADVIR